MIVALISFCDYAAPSGDYSDNHAQFPLTMRHDLSSQFCYKTYDIDLLKSLNVNTVKTQEVSDVGRIIRI